MAMTAGSLGSLYSPNAAFIDISSDYKARRVGDVVTLVVYENTLPIDRRCQHFKGVSDELRHYKFAWGNEYILGQPVVWSELLNPAQRYRRDFRWIERDHDPDRTRDRTSAERIANSRSGTAGSYQ